MKKGIATNRALKEGLRFRVYHPLRHIFDLASGRLERAGIGQIISILLVSDGAAYTSEQQFAALLSHRGDLRRCLGVVLNQKRLVDVVGAREETLRRYNVIALKLSFETSEATALDIVTLLRSKCGTAKLVYFDGDDDACVLWSRILEKVDLYVKKHTFAKISDYEREFVGKSNLTDYVARTYGRSFEDNIIPKSGKVEYNQLHKVVLGYNIAMDDNIRRLFWRHRNDSSPLKDIDIVCRASCPPDSWIYPLRGPISLALSGLNSRYRLLLPNQRVTQDQYYSEMRRSRICVSPFGYGEVCWRDFEAVIFRCLLVKPDMAHLRTEPNIFLPGETYVPVKWDFSDLAETCARYLSDEPAIKRITDRAFVVLAHYYEERGLAGSLQRLLRQLDCKPHPGVSVD